MNSICPNAIVIDTGSYSTKIGFAGNDEPQSIVRTATGILNNDDNKNNNNNNNQFEKYLIDSSLNTSDENKIEQMDINLPYQTGFVSNMESLSAIWFNTMNKIMRLSESDISSIPILLSEPCYWNNTSIYSHLFNKYRENYCYTLFESFNCCAMYLCCDSVLSSFSHGKKSSIVLDLGHGSTKCTPVYDGYVINNGCKFTKCGGHYFDQLINHKITKELNMEIIPKHLIATDNKKLNAKKSYIDFMKYSIITDIKENVLKVRNTEFDTINVPKNSNFNTGNLTFPYKNNDSYQNNNTYLAPLNLENEINNNDCKFIKIENDINDNETVNNNKVNASKQYVYTLPDGQTIECGDWQYFIPELLFMDYYKDFEYDLEDIWIDKMSKLQINESNNNNNNNSNNGTGVVINNTHKVWNDANYVTYKFKGIASMINESLLGCDIDIRELCTNNIIICGGNSKYKGIMERIIKELSINIPYSYKYKLYFNNIPRERVFNAWLGGSILADTTHFQNMWITKENYNEYGPNIVHRKCF